MDSIIRHHKSQKQSKNYFTQETENAIVLYNTTTNPVLKSKIYESKIHYPFYKLTENIIHTFKFYYTEVENLEDLQHEIITFLLEKIHLFDPSKGAKAYSYFGTIVKRWLIIYNEKNYKKQVSNITVNNLNNYSNLDTTDPGFIISQKVSKEIDTLLEEEDIYDNVEPETQGFKYDDRLSHFIDLYVDYCTKNIFNIFPKEYDAQIADAIGAGGNTTADKIANSRQAVQGLAQLTLQGRKQMRGEGAITESEGKLAERAMSGDLNFTAAEIRQLAEAAKRSAKFTYNQHQNIINTMQNNPDAKGLVPYFQVPADADIFNPRPVGGQSATRTKADQILQGKP